MDNPVFDQLLGLGRNSMHKSYYPELQQKIHSLEQMERNLLSIFHHSQDAILITDAEGAILDFNDRTPTLFSSSREQILTLHAQQLFSGEKAELPAFRHIWTNLTEDSFTELELQAVRPSDASVFPCTAVMNRISWFGSPAILLTVHDMTERYRQQQAVAKLLQELEDANATLERRILQRTQQLETLNAELQHRLEELEMTRNELIRSEKLASLGELVAGIAHEINTPLGVSVTAASFLEMLVSDIKKTQPVDGMLAARQETVDRIGTTSKLILSNLDKATRLIRSFKQVSVDQTSDAVRDFDLDAYMTELIVSLTPSFRNTGHVVENRIPAGIRVKSYAGALAQIVTNLMMNAILHAFPEGRKGTIRLEGRSDGEHFTLIVTDDGVGMEPAVREKIFDPFYTTKHNAGGTGLGLFIVHNLVQNQLKGQIRCESKPGEGTRFTLTLPAQVQVQLQA